MRYDLVEKGPLPVQQCAVECDTRMDAAHLARERPCEFFGKELDDGGELASIQRDLVESRAFQKGANLVERDPASGAEVVMAVATTLASR
jgi:hypothetical protein